MKILTVRKDGDRYIINDEISVPYVIGNRYYKDLSEWLKNNPNDVIDNVVNTDTNEYDLNYSESKNKILSKKFDPAVATWDIQRIEATLCLYVQEAPTPFLDGLAEERGESKRVLAKKILNKSKDYLYKIGKVTGQMQMKQKKGK
jgi:hypothetical protein